MHRTALALGALAALGALGASWAPAYRAGDVAELHRAAANGGAREVAQGLASRDRAAVLGAIVAAPAAPDAWELLDPLAAVAGGWDRSTAGPAARAAASIARGLDGDAAIQGDIPDDRLDAATAAWRALAERDDRWSDVRVHALEIATRLTVARAATAEDVPDGVTPLLALGDDRDPLVRRAAFELLPVPLPETARPQVVARVIAEDVPAVRLAAAQALCAALPDDAAAVIAALGPDGLAALRTAVLAVTPATAGGALDAARCLAADPDPRSQRAVIQLAHVAPRPVRAAVSRVGQAVRAAAKSVP